MSTTSGDLIEFLALAREAVRRQMERAENEREIAKRTNRQEDVRAWEGYIHALYWVETFMLPKGGQVDPTNRM